MKRRELRLARPLYEALPWFYVLSGLLALWRSYLHPSRFISVVLAVLGLLCVIGGIVVYLRRRDFREMRANYADTDSNVLRARED